MKIADRGSRIALIAAIAGMVLLTPPAARAEAEYAQVLPGRGLEFPRDHGSHPAFRTEWWYVTGWLEDARGGSLGFQVTFFRTRPAMAGENPSRFTARQVLIAHAALADPAAGKLVHEQRVARAGFGLAEAAEHDTDVHIDDWRLAREPGRYRARIRGRDLSLDLAFETTQPPLIQGDAGFSRKGPDPRSASHYYSVPQLRVSGSVTRGGRTEPVRGSAWLDHEWSSDYVAQGAAGWDWIGINLEDGGALMAFRMRGSGGETLWAGGTRRHPDGRTEALGRERVAFTPRRNWRSPRTGTGYPVEFSVRAGALEFLIEPLMDDQELDARRSTGTIYWEGAVRALRDGRPIGRGYLELTGYWKPMDL
ncbi:MAG TPA: carotenoid 1,2-hydratase [Burkholderiales bacterium]|nr:carotenoid 1,2-hydratase [Burkholderiales bacterium]